MTNQNTFTITADDSNNDRVGHWPHPLVIAETAFKYKSLSNWIANIAVGCFHGCAFCYVPSVSATKQAPRLRQMGVLDPDTEWGSYLALRRWDEKKFLASLRKAERTPIGSLNPDGNRAILYCSTTDPFQAIHHHDREIRRQMNRDIRHLVRRSLELIRDESTLNVRILTRSPLAKREFDLFQSFGPRLLFGMSLPTLRNDLARIYEPNAPSPSQRLRTLQAARAAGLHVYVAVAPTYPESDEADLRATLAAVRDLDPVTVFHEPINIRSKNVKRIAEHAQKLGVNLRTEVFETTASWSEYALQSLHSVEKIATDLDLLGRLHLWPDAKLGSTMVQQQVPNPEQHTEWLQKWWSRVSEWPEGSLNCPSS